MATVQRTIPAARRPDLDIRPVGRAGECVVKHPASGRFFRLGPHESFLLNCLDGARCRKDMCDAFRSRFDEPLTHDELEQFVGMARAKGLLEDVHARSESSTKQASTKPTGQGAVEPATAPRAARPMKRQSLLYWRVSLFDPDRLFEWLAPKIRFLWTPAFVVGSAGSVLLAAMIAWSHGGEFADSLLTNAVRWETLALAWLMLIGVTLIHEFAHGLTCKRFGGEVHEIGFLMLFFLPCMYCNVSDAWLFPDKRKRIWVTLAGTYSDLVIWALAVFTWRLTLEGSLPNYLACVIMSLTGIRLLFNFNPLLKLDGYYILCDLLEIHNLRQKAVDFTKRTLRWLLWGAPKPAEQPRAGFLLGYGAASWAFSVVVVGVILVAVAQLLDAPLGPLGMILALVLGTLAGRNLFRGVTNGEFGAMVVNRWTRAGTWLAALGGFGAALMMIEFEDWAAADFRIRSESRQEVRAEASGFLAEVLYDENQQVPAGAVVARLEVPDLASRIAQNVAECRQTRARLQMLQIGARPEEIDQQRNRVARLTHWRNLAKHALERKQEVLRKAVQQQDALLAAQKARRAYRAAVHERRQELRRSDSVSQERYELSRQEHLVASATYDQMLAERERLLAEGTLEAEQQLADREKLLADEVAKLTLLEVGSRPTQIEAAEAELERVKAEGARLRDLRQRLVVHSSVSGVMVTPHLDEQVGTFLEKGELICEVEDLDSLWAEVSLPEDETGKISTGQSVRLKARAAPFDTFGAEVRRIARKAEPGEVQGTVTVYCKILDPSQRLCPGMSGYAQIYCGQTTLGGFLSKKALRFVRTEFWW